MDALGTGQLGVSSLTTQFELALLAVMSAFGAGRGALVTTITTDTYSWRGGGRKKLVQSVLSCREERMDGWMDGKGREGKGNTQLTH